jgi:hypothetical protein
MAKRIKSSMVIIIIIIADNHLGSYSTFKLSLDYKNITILNNILEY